MGVQSWDRVVEVGNEGTSDIGRDSYGGCKVVDVGSDDSMDEDKETVGTFIKISATVAVN